ncbi:MAG TPA: aminoglycoside phosphotransferase family protein [Candidatus Aminicenantes bacterium]|nr:aminoglycoside phosphotransferase family protein [Candidatus Aminicenantes bacterium]
MTNEEIAGVLASLGMGLRYVRPDLTIAGSPERSLERRAVESDDGRLWIVERHDLRAARRKQEIAESADRLAVGLPEIKPWLPFAPNRFVAERGGGAWLVSPYVPGVALDRPAYAFEGWRGRALADLLIRFRAAASGLPREGNVPAFSLPGFVRGLFGVMRDHRRALFERLYPVLLHLEHGLFPAVARLPTSFSHGDLHPLNVIWSETGIEALIDLEFCGFRPETYDAALLVGCLGMEEPRSLRGDLVRTLIMRLREGAGFSDEGWRTFPDMVLGLRFAWLSDWLRRDNRDMVELEAVYIGVLMENRSSLERAWA